jgi:hypothetical protein
MFFPFDILVGVGVVAVVGVVTMAVVLAAAALGSSLVEMLVPLPPRIIP